MGENGNGTMVPADDLPGKFGGNGRGFDAIQVMHGATFADNSTVVLVPTRGMIHHRVVSAWQCLITPMNQKRYWIFCAGHEVGVAYNEMLKNVLAHPEFSKCKYVLTLEDDNIPPPDAHIRLIEAIEEFKFDAVSGIYFTKGDFNMPQCYGDPDHFRATGELEFRPRDVRLMLQRGNIAECNGIACGCALWRMDLFRELPPPWYVTYSDWYPDKGVKMMTQDLAWCETLRRAGKRLAVDFRVRTGHIDVNTGIVY